MPDLADLPEELRARLPAVQWMEVYEDLFAASMQRIIADIEHSTGLISPTAYLPDHVSVVLINTSSSVPMDEAERARDLSICPGAWSIPRQTFEPQTPQAECQGSCMLLRRPTNAYSPRRLKAAP